MRWRGAALVAGAVGIVWLLTSVGLGRLVADVADDIIKAGAKAGLALPATLALHAVQLTLSGIAWRIAIGVGPGIWQMARIRWIREGVNTMLPFAHIGGQVVAGRLLVTAGVPPVLAVAGLVLDLTYEAASQLIVTLAGVAALLLRPGGHAWLGWVEGGLVAIGLTVAGLIAAQRLGALRLVETALERAARRWKGTAGWSLAGLHVTLMQRQADRRAMISAVLIHCVGWSLGTFEVWIFLHALGRDVGLGPAFVIESLAMAARSAGFAVPGAVGVQEGGFVLVCGLFGIGVETALALSVLKRLRELVVGVSSLVAWQFPRLGFGKRRAVP